MISNDNSLEQIRCYEWKIYIFFLINFLQQCFDYNNDYEYGYDDVRYQCEHQGWSRRRNSPGWWDPPAKIISKLLSYCMQSSLPSNMISLWSANHCLIILWVSWYLSVFVGCERKSQCWPAGTAWAPPPGSSSRSRGRSSWTRTWRSPSARPCTHSHCGPAASLQFGSSEGEMCVHVQ